MGAFSHSAGTAPIITVMMQVTTLKTTCGIMHNQFKTQKFKHLMLAMGPRDLNSAPYSPVHCTGGGEKCGRRDWKKMRKNAEKMRKMREKMRHKMRFC